MFRLTLDSLAWFEEETESMKAHGMSISVLRMLVCAMLGSSDHDVTPRAVGRWLDPRDRSFIEQFSEAVRIALPDAQGGRNEQASNTSTTDWPALWAAARCDLGLSSDEFWGLTPRGLNLLLEHRGISAFAPSALICATIAECHRDPAKRSEPFSPSDFLPRLPEPPMSEEEHLAMMRAKLEMYNAAFGGTDLRTHA